MADRIRQLTHAGLLVLLGCAAQPALGDTVEHAGEVRTAKIYRSMVGGVPTFSDIPPTKGRYIVYTPSCFACNLKSSVNWDSTRLHHDAYHELIQSTALQFAVDPALVRAVIHAESNFNPRARSPKGAMGLMQLMPATARSLGVTDAHSPAQNIQGGVRYLAGLLEQYQGNITLAAAAYNAGPGAVQKYSGIPPYAETRVYVQRVRTLYERYRTGR